MRTATLRFAVVLLLVAGSACASSGGGVGGRDPNLITTEEIRAQGPDVGDAYRLVQRLHPNWLRSRVSSPSAGGRVYARVLLDDRPYGELESLRNLRLPELLSLEYLSATEATTRFGTGYLSGAILVRTRP